MSEDTISRQAAIDAMGRATWAINRINELPSAQPKSANELAEKVQNAPNDDFISRKVAIDALDKHLQTTDVPVSYPGIISALTEWLNEVPSAQPELPEWAQKVEEYRKSAPSFVRNQLVWALYQTWKEYDGQLVHQRGKENR